MDDGIHYKYSGRYSEERRERTKSRERARDKKKGEAPYEMREYIASVAAGTYFQHCVRLLVFRNFAMYSQNPTDMFYLCIGRVACVELPYRFPVYRKPSSSDVFLFRFLHDFFALSSSLSLAFQFFLFCTRPKRTTSVDEKHTQLALAECEMCAVLPSTRSTSIYPTLSIYLFVCCLLSVYCIYTRVRART